MATVKIIIREDRIKLKNGEAPLFLRIIKNRKIKYISLGISVKPEDWNYDKMRVRKRVKNYQVINTLISNKIADAENIILKTDLSKKPNSVLDLKNKVSGNDELLFLDYWYSQKDLMSKNRKIDTIKSYESTINVLEEYLNDKPLYFKDIDVEFIKKYEKYLYDVRDNSTNSVKNKFKIIKLLFTQAINDGKVDANYYPFNKYRLKTSPSTRSYLNNEQFDSLLSYEVKKNMREELFYDMYIFSAYAGGLRFADVIDLKWSDYNKLNHRISKLIRKTGRMHRFMLPKKAIEILNKYKNEDSKNNDYVFPLLNNNYDYKLNPEIFFKEKSSWNALGNKILRNIGKKLEFPFSLTFHTSRHTFATRALNKGMRIEHVSKLLDHNNIKITQIYAKIMDEELDKAVSILDD